MNSHTLTDKWYLEHYYDKLTHIFQNEPIMKHMVKQSGGNPIQLASYNPMELELNISPIVSQIINDSKWNISHSYPIVQSKN